MTSQNITSGELENIIKYDFKNKDLLVEALTHRSYLNENTKWHLPHNERLEFLGDAVLELAVSESLFKKFPKEDEGKMTVLRAALVNYQMLAKIGSDLRLEDFIMMSKGEKGGSVKAKEVIIANAMEALIGALYMDGGFTVAEKFISRFIFIHIDEVLKTGSYRDAKSELQELIQDKMKVTPSYGVIEETGPAHEKQFKIGVYFGEELIAEGRGASKQEGEIEAAKEALKKYK
ncbi:MAG TPA: ribonuclease III [Candidatus Paceibacterota bacterium]|nr:ribonuclease III [Candidatus Paceibacterota bacterium]